MSAHDYDVTVIGGGIHGVGVAQAAAAAGHRVCLLEARDLAAGTSSKSSKLIHGGLRYLESFELGLVRESLRERTTLLRIAPELVHLVPFLIPIYETTTRRPYEIRAGLSLYSLLAGLGQGARFGSVARERWESLDGLRLDGLQHVFRYHDAQTDDAALTRAVMRSAQELGAELQQPAELIRATRLEHGYDVLYSRGGMTRSLSTSVLVNAGGPWAEIVRARIEPRPAGFAIDLVGGTHIELPGKVTSGCFYTEAPDDRRAVFTMPWKGRTLVGTTERFFEGDPAAIEPTPEEIEYLRRTFLHYFPNADATVVDAWAGLRVLQRKEGAAFKRTRETVFRTDDGGIVNYLAIYGGKLTGYRATAEKVLAQLAPTLPRRRPIARTDELPLTPDH